MDDDVVLKNSLNRFSEGIDRYRETLNQEGVWLFLATLGCWSVQGDWTVLIALLLTFALFSYRVYGRVEYRRTFAASLRDLRAEVASSSLAEDMKKDRLRDIQQLESTKLSNFRHAKETAVFLFCYSFLVLSAIQRLFGFSW